MVTARHPTRREVVNVGIAIVTYNNSRDILSLCASMNLDAEKLVTRILVVDNGSSDDTVAVARGIPGVRVIVNEANAGFAGGVNVALHALGDEVDAVAVLNPDAVVAPGALRELAAALTDPSVGVAVPRVTEPDGEAAYSLRREPGILTALGDAAVGSRLRRRPAWLSDTLWDPRAYEHDHDVDWASGAAWMVARDVVGCVGPMDERYFLYSEEVEYARRVRRHGWRVRYVASAEVAHVGGASGRSAALDALRAMNRVKDYRSCHLLLPSLVFGAVVVGHQAVRSSRGTYADVTRLLLRPRSWRMPAREFVAWASR
ncbi:GT2 family glycosyltransferase [Terracoccus luteus]|uniref:GT2 family glycosyltransferase n=1 Tax=Terracoccus luteus TaxID=53356 RepID=A0A495XWY7_9MICO|nr:glycosyltransferase family 2 protein [Terracoccus luteus]RKT78482.1 GT2 family glycosyltransferase [Terracoccus luteus]